MPVNQNQKNKEREYAPPNSFLYRTWRIQQRRRERKEEPEE